MTIETIHKKDERGEQVTERVVHTEDPESGETFEHRFRVTEEGHAYQGEGEPPQAAVDALRSFDDRLDVQPSESSEAASADTNGTTQQTAEQVQQNRGDGQ